MIEKYGDFPYNARVDVDYSSGKPKVKFSYPKKRDRKGKLVSGKKQAEQQHTIGIHTILIILVAYILFGSIISSILCGEPFPIIPEQEYPTSCSITYDWLNISTYVFAKVTINNASSKSTINTSTNEIIGANITCNTGVYSLDFDKTRTLSISPGFKEKENYSRREALTKLAILFSLGWLILYPLFLINKILTKFLIKQKWYQKWFPKKQGEKASYKKYIKFLPKDVENNFVEIPSFKNIVLDYKTKGDFSDKLERIKIHEHSWREFNKGKVGKKKVDVWKWYARFYFKETPKNGHLEVIFK